MKILDNTAKRGRLVYLSTNPEEAVQWLTDGDVIRLPIEIGQVLVTVWRNVQPRRFGQLIEYSRDHAWVAWAQENQANYIDLWNYALDICDEYEFRFGARLPQIHRHNMVGILTQMEVIPPLPEADMVSLYPINTDDARANYKGEGVFDKYTNRNQPEWYKS
jgi:hypothetical protein